MNTFSCACIPQLKIKGGLISLNPARVMGIINCTPDSFYEGSRQGSEKLILQKVEQMLSEGATFLDLGGQSTRPGATPVSAEEELKRVIPAIKIILNQFPNAVISVDTFYPEVAFASINEGATIINDVSGGQYNGKMFDLVAKYQIPYILMHSRGNAQTMQQLTGYQNLEAEIIAFFNQQLSKLKAMGLEEVIIDPGFGFAKNAGQNFRLLKNLKTFQILDKPILAGISRKAMIYKTLGTGAEQALNGTTALHVEALKNGANILRVHDVAPAMEAIKLVANLNYFG